MKPIPPPDPPPPLRRPELPLPPFRFIPGASPRSAIQPGNHGMIGLTLTGDRALAHGLDLFDHRFYWECHEVLEGAWHQVAREAPTSALLQGLIQAAACVLKAHMGREASPAPEGHARAAVRLRARTAAQLARAGPQDWLDSNALLEGLDAAIAGPAWPRIQGPRAEPRTPYSG